MWCDKPDVLKGNAGEHAAPVCCNTAATQGGGNDVAELLPELKALEGAVPHKVQTVDAIGLSKDLLKGDLWMKER